MSGTAVIDAVGKHTASVFILHGLGDTAAGWTPVARILARRFSHVKWVLPTAPMQPVTLNMGYKMPSWFDIKSLNPPPAGRGPGDEDEKGMLESVAKLTALVRQEIDAGIPANRIVVGGFSQGAVISLLTAITTEYKLAGVIALSGFLGLSGKIESMQTEHARKLPIFWGHGKSDDVVRYTWAEASVDKLKSLKFENIEFHGYDRMAHSFCEEEQQHLEAWIEKHLPEQS